MPSFISSTRSDPPSSAVPIVYPCPLVCQTNPTAARPTRHRRRGRLTTFRCMAHALALDHLVLVVADVGRSLAWYQQHFGLEGVRVEEWRNGEVPFPSLRVDPTTIIDLIPGHDGARGHLDHICFVVSDDDLDDAKAD